MSVGAVCGRAGANGRVRLATNATSNEITCLAPDTDTPRTRARRSGIITSPRTAVRGTPRRVIIQCRRTASEGFERELLETSGGDGSWALAVVSGDRVKEKCVLTLEGTTVADTRSIADADPCASIGDASMTEMINTPRAHRTAVWPSVRLVNANDLRCGNAICAASSSPAVGLPGSRRESTRGFASHGCPWFALFGAAARPLHACISPRYCATPAAAPGKSRMD